MYRSSDRRLGHSYWLGPSLEDQTWLASTAGSTCRSLDALSEAEVALMKKKDDIRQFAPGYPIPGANADKNKESAVRTLESFGSSRKGRRMSTSDSHRNRAMNDADEEEEDGTIIMHRRRARSESDDDAAGLYDSGGDVDYDIEGEDEYSSGSTEEGARDPRLQFNVSMSP